MIQPIFDSQTWARVPFHFWSVVFFVFGSVVGSFLNVCIHRLPLGQSIVSPPSHCPHCRYSIPWYLNIPLVTWLWLGGRCRNCGASISARYFVVELLTASLFLATWLHYGRQSAAVTLVYCLVISGLIAAAFIDFEHFIIPDQITLGGVVMGVFCSILVPMLHGQTSRWLGAGYSVLGAAAGAGIIYACVRGGKFLFGRERIRLGEGSRVVFGESCLHLPDHDIEYGEVFYRKSDIIFLQAAAVEMADRCYWDAPVILSQMRLQVGGDEFDPEQVPYLSAICSEVVLPREAMGLGDVKFMAAIGAFLGWPAVIASLVASSILGAAVGISLILAKRRAFKSPMQYGPYIAFAAVLWIFFGHEFVRWLLTRHAGVT